MSSCLGVNRGGDYRPVIDRVYPLEEVIEAHRYVDAHQKAGNVVLSIPLTDGAELPSPPCR
jgi:NADPH:quinone reductase-like Zn-dependent oxidoreductase